MFTHLRVDCNEESEHKEVVEISEDVPGYKDGKHIDLGGDDDDDDDDDN